ncbi:hypothetical protein P175DRAFT_0528276 [Aspergillus ochraceoroseus IBT 24754]|uniref:Cytochrome P450 n=2 Tax=Aspergillus ochraceoroseus TaxID=138278 RepID=A0A2T5M8A5_9EURO|nr:uncharacterized protein P175DRAFT_0528276 [Aspergillus ochraceoroseus IBT 24754]KKK12917.1 hypothetical protein AOCH_000478 [Aspergillus ochraceoroseus]PTU24767.1 hypothetical protein P175DRAFT_0528276 [Aspergillus ochraceoroseus IBT 24754]
MEALGGFISPTFVTLLLGIFIAPGIWTAIQRLYFHPLRHIPGPRLAAISDWYGYWYNVFGNGSYIKSFPDLHRESKSAVIRIGPNHIHVSDLDFYHIVFGTGSKYQKDITFYRDLMDAPGAFLSITDPYDFRQYRHHFSSLFSARAVTALLPTMMVELEKVSRILLAAKEEGKPVDLQHIYRSVTGDIACEAMLARSPEFLSEGERGHPLLGMLDVPAGITWLSMALPQISTILSAIPIVGKRVTDELCKFSTLCGGWSQEAQTQKMKGITPDRRGYFDLILDMDHCDRVKHIPNPLKDPFDLLIAGVGTTSHVLSCASFYILNDPNVLRRLREELDAENPFANKTPDINHIRALPYLTAVVRESLRMAHPTPGLIPRVVPPGGAQIGSVSVPGGVTISMANAMVEMNEVLFPEPHRFNPDRWMKSEKDVEKWVVAFSKGPRKCPGMNIAYMQLYCCIAYIFSQFDLELFQTNSASMAWADNLSGQNKEHVKVMVKALH